MPLSRRQFNLGLATSLASAPALLRAQSRQSVRIGFQKGGLPVIAQRLGTIERQLAARNVTVDWKEFTAGLALVEALNVGAIDLGQAGDAPPIFGQVAGANFRYIAVFDSNGQDLALFTKEASGIQDVAGLRGKRIGVPKGTSAHSLLVVALEDAGLALDDVTIVFLAPQDAAAAFQSDRIDAWSIWDPFFAIAQARTPVRVLAQASDVPRLRTNDIFYLANANYAQRNPEHIQLVLAGLAEAATWAGSHRGEVAQALHEITGVPLAIQTAVAERAVFGVSAVDDKVIAKQQATADRFHSLGLIPRQVQVRELVWQAS